MGAITNSLSSDSASSTFPMEEAMKVMSLFSFALTNRFLVDMSRSLLSHCVSLVTFVLRDSTSEMSVTLKSMVSRPFNTVMSLSSKTREYPSDFLIL